MPTTTFVSARITATLLSVTCLLSLTGCLGDGSPKSPESPGPGVRLTPEGYAQGMADCLTERGWNARSVGDELQASTSDTDSARFDADFDECTRLIGADKPPSLSDAEWKTLHRKYVETIKCLQAIDVDIPDGVDYDEFRSKPLGSYYAYKLIPPDVLEQRFDDLEDRCPQPSL
jgi:hypothetical protein